MTIATITYGLLGYWVLCNIGTLFIGHKPSDMYQNYWVDQCWVGRILANLFYAPAWIISIAMYFISKTPIKWVMLISHYVGVFSFGVLIAALIVYGVHWVTILGIVLALLLAICTKIQKWWDF